VAVCNAIERPGQVAGLFISANEGFENACYQAENLQVRRGSRARRYAGVTMPIAAVVTRAIKIMREGALLNPTEPKSFSGRWCDATNKI
jgi:hypothetical protein